MTYTITVVRLGNYLWQVNVVVMDGETEVLAGETTIGCETEQEARDYAEHVFLPDLRTNFPRKIGSLTFSWEMETASREVMPE